MILNFKRFILSRLTRLTLTYATVVVWLSYTAWIVAWPVTWLSLPFLLCLGHTIFRLIFELVFNRINIPTMATCFVARQKIAETLQREASVFNKAPYYVVDLGSGRGELARCIAKRIPKARVTGIELARFPYMQACFIQRWFGPKNLSFERLNFWSFDCTNVGAAVLYLGPITAQRMGEKLHKELKQGSVVISNTYPLLGKWAPIEVLTFRSPFKENLYVYRR